MRFDTFKSSVRFDSLTHSSSRDGVSLCHLRSACQVSLRPKSGGSMSARREWERDRHARSTSSFLRVLNQQAAHPTQRQSDGKSKPRLRGFGRSGADLTRERDSHRCPRSECRSGDRRCFARNSRDARNAEGRVVGCEHERVRE